MNTLVPMWPSLNYLSIDETDNVVISRLELIII